MVLKLIILIGCMVYKNADALYYDLGGSFTEHIDGDCMCMKYEIYCQQPNGNYNYNMKARQFCRSRSIENLGPKGRLAIFRNEAIEGKVRQFIIDNDLNNSSCIPKYGFWIGLSDRIHEGEYVWSDGVSLCHEDYRNWAPGEPNNNTNKKPSIGQDCVQLWFRDDNDGLWDDEYCNVKPKGFICEIPDPYCHSEDST